jgi:hypothetical protein
LHSFLYSFKVFSLLNLSLCPMLPSLTYVNLSGNRFLVAPLEEGIVTALINT